MRGRRRSPTSTGRRSGSGCAVGARAGEHDLVLVDVIAESIRDAVDRALEPRVGERLDLAAVAADEVMVVVSVRRRRLVARDPATGVDALDKPQLRERLERAVDRGDPDRTLRRT